MSKAFKSAVTVSGNRTLLVSTDIGMDAGFFLEVQDEYEGNFLICFNSDTAPALALAIFEAAGVEPDREPLECHVSLGTIVADLQDTIRHGEALAAEAEAQAKLEAEALELFNAGDVEGEFQSGPYDSFAQIQDYAKPKWLAVARRAREINKEEK